MYLTAEYTTTMQCMASRPMAADHPTGRPTVLSGVRTVPEIRPNYKAGTHAAPTDGTLGNIPEMGVGSRGPIHPRSSTHRK